MRLASALLLCGLSLQVLAAPPDVQIVPPPEPEKWSPLAGPAGRVVLLKAEPASTWHQVGGPQLDWRPVERTGYVAVTGPAGVYRFTVASGGEVARYELTLGDGPFVPPAPTDALVKDLRDRYAADPSPTKKADMASLAALYALMVTEAGNAEYATAAALNQTFVTARDRMLSDGKGGPVRLPTVRARCGQEVAAVIGDQSDTPITAELRKATGATYARLSAAVTEAAK